MSALPSTRPTPRPVAGALPPHWQRGQSKPQLYLNREVVCSVRLLGDKLRVHVEDEVTEAQLAVLGDDLRALRGWLARGGR